MNPKGSLRISEGTLTAIRMNFHQGSQTNDLIFEHCSSELRVDKDSNCKVMSRLAITFLRCIVLSNEACKSA